MFDNIFAAIEKWMRELLSGMVESNLSTMFTAVNQQTSEIAAQVGQTPQGWNSSIFSMIRNISDSVVIIARDDFEKVQEILTKNQKVFKTVRAESEQIRTEYQNDLAGMVFCADCGRSMDFDRLPHGAEESKKVCYYICRARQADDKCIGHQITEKLLKALVMDQLHLFIVRLSDKRKVLEELRKIEDMQNPVYRAKSEIMSLTDKVSQMAKKREQLYEQENCSMNLKCRLYRSKWVQSITVSDVMESGQVVENPMIGAIPSRNEVQRELDDLLMSM